MNSFQICGLDTFETMTIEAKKALPLELCKGPTIWSSNLGANVDKLIYLYPVQLGLLYGRFKAANPKGVVFGRAGSFDEYAPPGLSRKELEKLEEERKIFVELFLSDEDEGYPSARKYLPELFERGVIDRMVADPWLDVVLLRRAIEAGAVAARGEISARWTPEWRAYCDRLLTSGAHQ